MIRVAGLTGKEKKKLNFSESTFVTALSYFCKDQNLTASSVRFTRELTGFSTATQVYLAELGSETSKELIVTFFPKLPDFYLFALKEKEPEETKNQKEEPARMTEEMPALEMQGAEPETEKDRTQETESVYDAWINWGKKKHEQFKIIEIQYAVGNVKTTESFKPYQ